MAAGLTDKMMDVADIVRLIDAHEIERKGKAAQSFRVSVRVDRPSLTDLRGVSYTTSFRRLRSAWSARRSQACAILSHALAAIEVFCNIEAVLGPYSILFRALTSQHPNIPCVLNST